MLCGLEVKGVHERERGGGGKREGERGGGEREGRERNRERGEREREREGGREGGREEAREKAREREGGGGERGYTHVRARTHTSARAHTRARAHTHTHARARAAPSHKARTMNSNNATMSFWVSAECQKAHDGAVGIICNPL